MEKESREKRLMKVLKKAIKIIEKMIDAVIKRKSG